MSLPKRFKTIFHILLFLSVVSTGTVFAQYMPKLQPGQYGTHETQAPPAVSLPEKTPTQGDVQYLPKSADPGASTQLPSGDPQVRAAVSCGPFGFVCNSVKSIFEALGDCGANIFCYMAGGVQVVEREVLNQTTGCGNVDTPNGYQDCQQKYQALLNGGTLADVESPGAIFMLAGVADQGFRMPVPIEHKQYIASINPFEARTAHAQAVTELENSGLQILWRGFRNAAFALSAVVLVVIGFMIMFRSRLDPRTTITAMNSLPKIIFALILTYFSFALSGLMLDFGRLALQFVNGLIPLQGGALLSGLLQLILLIILAFAAGFVLGVAGLGPGGIAAASLVAVGLLILLLILAIFILIIVITILVHMLKRYGQFIVYTIFAPFFFLWGAMPGQSSFGWFKSQLANVLAIPAMFLVVRLAAYIGINSFVVLNNSNKITLPSPFDAGFGTSTGAAGLAWFLLAPLVALALLFYATKMPAILDGILGIKDYGSRAGFGPGAIIAAPMGALNKVNKATGPLSNITSAAVQRGGMLSRLASPLHTGLRAVNDQSQSYIPSVKELRTGAVEKRVQSGRLSYARQDALGSVKTPWKEEWKKNNILTPGIDADIQAERAWSQTHQDYETKMYGGTPALAPKRTPAQHASQMDSMVRDYGQELRNQGAAEDDINKELLSWARSGLNDAKKKVVDRKIVP